jgi:hypothetical protein
MSLRSCWSPKIRRVCWQPKTNCVVRNCRTLTVSWTRRIHRAPCHGVPTRSILLLSSCLGRRYNIDGVVTSVRTEHCKKRGSVPDWGKKFIPSSRRPFQLWSPSWLFSLVSGAMLSGLKRPSTETDHSPPPSVAVKSELKCASTYPVLPWSAQK